VRCSRRSQKLIKTLNFESLGFFKVITVGTTEKLVSSACCDSMSVPNCNRSHERLAINSKITTFTGVPHFDALVRTAQVSVNRKNRDLDL